MQSQTVKKNEEDIALLQSKVQGLSEQQNSQQMQIDSLKSNQNSQNQQIGQQQKQINIVQQLLSKANRQIQYLYKRYGDIQQLYAQLNQKHIQLQQVVKNMSSDISGLHKSYDQIYRVQAQMQKLTQIQDRLKQRQNQIQQIMKSVANSLVQSNKVNKENKAYNQRRNIMPLSNNKQSLNKMLWDQDQSNQNQQQMDEQSFGLKRNQQNYNDFKYSKFSQGPYQQQKIDNQIKNMMYKKQGLTINQIEQGYGESSNYISFVDQSRIFDHKMSKIKQNVNFQRMTGIQKLDFLNKMMSGEDME